MLSGLKRFKEAGCVWGDLGLGVAIVAVEADWGAWCFSDWGSFSSRESIG